MFAEYSNRLLGTILLVLLLGASASPLQRYPFPDGVVPRQQLAATTAVSSTAAETTTHAASTVSQSQAATQSRQTAVVSSTSSAASQSGLATSTSAARSSQTSATATTSTQASRTSVTSSAASSTSPSSTVTSTSAAATSTSQPSSIFSKSSPYYSYAIAIIVVVSIFGFLLLVLVIRFLVQCFIKKPKSDPITTNLGAGAWRHSGDNEFTSAHYLPASTIATRTTPDMRHKDLDGEMSERHAFLSSEDVRLYAPGTLDKTEPTRYNDEEPAYPNRARSLSGSSGSGSHSAVPFVSRRPTTMSFLNSPPATHPAFVVHPGSESGHSEEAQNQLRSVPEESAAAPNVTSNLLLARAGHSNAYRQQTLASNATDLSRAASTASAYSQLSTSSSAPPVPALPPQFVPHSHHHLSADVSAALSSMRGRRKSTDSIDTIKTTAPPTEEGTATPSAPVARSRPGRVGLPGRAPTSIHGPDLYFGH